jgi:FdhD protein
VVRGPEEIADISYCRSTVPESRENVVSVSLRPGTSFDPERFSRNVFTNSACGVCGKTSLEMIRAVHPHHPAGDTAWYARDFLELPGRLAARQAAFSRTGGLHAAGLFDYTQNLILLREDVGRHNAVDKVVGWLLLRERIPASDHLILVSGRASYELVQKVIAAGVPMLAAVGAPSSLAVDLAREYGVTLVGFLRDGRFNVYSGAERIRE